MKERGQIHALATYPWENSPNTHWIGDWVGSGVNVDFRDKRISYPY
jgi:hypothetical protein